MVISVNDVNEIREEAPTEVTKMHQLFRLYSVQEALLNLKKTSCHLVLEEN
jgi:hypothetical protein